MIKLFLKRFLAPVIPHVKRPINKWPDFIKRKRIMDLYESRMGYRFDIDNPSSFTEKIQWYKLYFDNGHLEHLVDKALFKSYIANKLGEGYTIPMYNVYSNIEELVQDWDNLPNEFVLKSTVQSDGNFIKIIRNKDIIDISNLKKEVADWFNPYKTLINSFCRAYYRAKPRVLVEQYMSQFNDQLYDYKLFCFNGKPYYVYVAMDHFQQSNYPITFYDMEWKVQNVQYGNHKVENAPKPKHWDEMKKIAERLSNGFPFLRVDFFDTDDKLYVAELTLYPGGGLSPYNPNSFNNNLGKLFKLPEL